MTHIGRSSVLRQKVAGQIKFKMIIFGETWFSLDRKGMKHCNLKSNWQLKVSIVVMDCSGVKNIILDPEMLWSRSIKQHKKETLN